MRVSFLAPRRELKVRADHLSLAPFVTAMHTAECSTNPTSAFIMYIVFRASCRTSLLKNRAGLI